MSRTTLQAARGGVHMHICIGARVTALSNFRRLSVGSNLQPLGDWSGCRQPVGANNNAPALPHDGTTVAQHGAGAPLGRGDYEATCTP